MINDHHDLKLEEIDEQETIMTKNSIDKWSKKRTDFKALSEIIYDKLSTFLKNVHATFMKFQLLCWTIFLTIIYFQKKKLIKKIWKNAIHFWNWKYDKFKQQVQWHKDNWKYKVIQDMKLKIVSWCNLNKINTFSIITKMKSLMRYFKDKFSASTFQYIFHFINDAINVKKSIKTSKNCLYFFKSKLFLLNSCNIVLILNIKHFCKFCSSNKAFNELNCW